ncbi:MAG: hemolysin-activating ACP:hemolysin acyltransferase [Halieaceae bacterium]|jgi:hemolysin-activating ACP:hemolysin acyltransferase
MLSFAQEIRVLTYLDSEIEETSGLLNLNGKLITHNDSGGEPILYVLDMFTGKVLRSVYIKNAKNVDWEDICSDEKFIYIADIGNNRGKRKNLKIYRIKKDKFLTQDTVKAKKIDISYGDQKNFKPGKFMTNYDAETLVSVGDSLYIFTKNWGNHLTRMYAVSKNIGEYELFPRASFKARCLVTSGNYNTENNEIVFSGYLFNKQFVMRLNNFTEGNLKNGNFISKEFKVPENSSKQIEGITHDIGYEYYISSEAYQGNTQVLYKLIWAP